jgi:hypothetical protein
MSGHNCYSKMNKPIYFIIYFDIIDCAIDLSTNAFEVSCLMPYNVPTICGVPVPDDRKAGAPFANR